MSLNFDKVKQWGDTKNTGRDILVTLKDGYTYADGKKSKIFKDATDARNGLADVVKGSKVIEKIEPVKTEAKPVEAMAKEEPFKEVVKKRKRRTKAQIEADKKEQG